MATPPLSKQLEGDAQTTGTQTTDTQSAQGPAPGAAPLPRPAMAVGPLRILLLTLGFVFIGLGVLGIVLPLLPTTPFLLLAAACFVRSSIRFNRWVLHHRVFGPIIRDWQEHRAIARRTKLIAIAMSFSTMTASAIFAVPHPAGKAVVMVCAVVLAIWMYRLPTR